MSSYSYLAAKDFDKNIFTPMFDTLISYLPDSIILGTGIFGILTLSFPIMFLFLFELETIFVQNLMGRFTTETLTPLGAPQTSDGCKTGYFAPPSRDRITLLKLFGEGGSFPSRPLFLLSAVFGYLISSLMAFQDVISNLDNDFKMRLTLAGVGTLITLGLVLVYYMRGGCVGFLGGSAAIVLGVMLGFVLMNLHQKFFGLEAVNFLGLPTIVSKTEKGSPLYVCAPSPTS